MAALHRLAKIAGSFASRTIIQQGTSEITASRTAVQHMNRQSRAFASEGHHDSVTYAGLTLHKPARWHVVTGQALGGLMWFWIFYRFYHDYDTFLFGHAQHHEHALHSKGHDEDHGTKEDH